jgi:hypothetical protein
VLRREFPTKDDEKRVTACIDKLYASIELQLDARCAEALLNRFPPPRQLAHISATDADAPATSQVVQSTEIRAEP